MVKPKDQQIAEDLRTQINSDSLPRGNQLPTEAELCVRGREASMPTPKVELQFGPEDVANRLWVGPGTPVMSRHQERYIDNLPWSLQATWYPMESVTNGATRLLLAEDIQQGAVKYLAEAIGRRQEGRRAWITARGPDANEQKFFGIAHDAAVFEIFRTGFDQGKRLMRVTVTVFPTDRNQFIVNVGDVPGPRDDVDPRETN